MTGSRASAPARVRARRAPCGRRRPTPSAGSAVGTGRDQAGRGCGGCGAGGKGVEAAGEVVPKILEVLTADTEPEQAGRDVLLVEELGSALHRALDAAEAGGGADDGDVVAQVVGRVG